jgi:hypothetical protein
MLVSDLCRESTGAGGGPGDCEAEGEEPGMNRPMRGSACAGADELGCHLEWHGSTPLHTRLTRCESRDAFAGRSATQRAMRPIEGAECGSHAEEIRCRTRMEWISSRYPAHERDMATRRAEAMLRREAPIGIEPMMEVLQTSALPLGYGAGNGKPSAGQRVPQSCRAGCRQWTRGIGENSGPRSVVLPTLDRASSQECPDSARPPPLHRPFPTARPRSIFGRRAHSLSDPRTRACRTSSGRPPDPRPRRGSAS